MRDVSYSWSDGPYYSTHEDDYYKCMSKVWRYIGENKVGDWMWLMSVVEKIESIGYSVETRESCCAVYNGYGVIIFSVKGGECSKKESVYKCCTLFVKWYNANVK